MPNLNPREAESLWMNGYDSARDVCLSEGLIGAEIWLAANPAIGPFRAGFMAAARDYADMNGLPFRA